MNVKFVGKEVLKDYVKGLLENGVIPAEMAKKVSVSVRVAVPGEQVDTILKNGTVEKTEIIPDDGVKRYVVKNANTPETYARNADEFDATYHPDPDNPGWYLPNGGRDTNVFAFPLTEDVTIEPPNWGGTTQNMCAGSYIVVSQRDANDIYGIGKDEMPALRYDTGKSAYKCVAEALTLLGSELSAQQVLGGNVVDDLLADAAERSEAPQGGSKPSYELDK